LVRLPDSTVKGYRAYPYSPFHGLFLRIERSVGSELTFVYHGQRLERDKNMSDYDMQQGDIIHARPLLKGGKPVIYLLSPTEVDASVTLSLTPNWSFSAVYPVVPIQSSPRCGNQIQWNVKVHGDGNLTELSTGLQMAYLFWEAQ
jgi:ubiquitin C